jgi:hypothetical protein
MAAGRWEMLIDVYDFAYEITEDRGGTYRIEPRVAGAAMYADTVDGARALIITNYLGKPVPMGSRS